MNFLIINDWEFDIQELTSSAGEDVVFAMNSFIKRLLAVSDPAQLKVCNTKYLLVLVYIIIIQTHELEVLSSKNIHHKFTCISHLSTIKDF